MNGFDTMKKTILHLISLADVRIKVIPLLLDVVGIALNFRDQAILELWRCLYFFKVLSSWIFSSLYLKLVIISKLASWIIHSIIEFLDYSTVLSLIVRSFPHFTFSFCLEKLFFNSVALNCV